MRTGSLRSELTICRGIRSWRGWADCESGRRWRWRRFGSWQAIYTLSLTNFAPGSRGIWQHPRFGRCQGLRRVQNIKFYSLWILFFTFDQLVLIQLLNIDMNFLDRVILFKNRQLPCSFLDRTCPGFLSLFCRFHFPWPPPESALSPPWEEATFPHCWWSSSNSTTSNPASRPESPSREQRPRS